MRVIKTSDVVDEAVINEVVVELKAGGIVAFPTETFYGLGAIWSDTTALSRLFRLKRRTKDKPVPLIIGDVSVLSAVAATPEKIALSIIEKFWPGPLTILFAAKAGLPELITGGTGKVALRVPGKSCALDVARAARIPITATSANISGKAPARSADEVIRYFGEDVDIVIDSGPAPGEKPSTIIDMSGGGIRLVREGLIPYNEILKAARD